jgi:uncharacterized membrane protein
MENRLSIRGNAVEPVLLMFPLGLLAVAVVLDVFQMSGGPRIIGTLAYCTVIAGLLGGTTTVLAVRIGEMATGSRAEAKAATRRFLLHAAVLVVFAVVLLVRMRTPERTAGPGLLLIELMGLSMAMVAGVAPSSLRRARGGAANVRLAQLLDDPQQHPYHEDREVHPERTRRSPARRRKLNPLARVPAGVPIGSSAGIRDPRP